MRQTKVILSHILARVHEGGEGESQEEEEKEEKEEEKSKKKKKNQVCLCLVTMGNWILKPW